MKRLMLCVLALMLLTGCMYGGSEIVLPDRTPVQPPAEPEPTPEMGDRYLAAGDGLLGVLTADGRWLAAGTQPGEITGWTLYGETVTRQDTLPEPLPAGTLAVSGSGLEPVSLQTGPAWEPAADLLYAALRTVTGTEPLNDPPRVTPVGSLTGEDGSQTRFLTVRGSYSLLMQERDGVYTVLPGVCELLGAFREQGQLLLFCADEAGAPRLLGLSGGEWHCLLPVS